MHIAHHQSPRSRFNDIPVLPSRHVLTFEEMGNVATYLEWNSHRIHASCEHVNRCAGDARRVTLERGGERLRSFCLLLGLRHRTNPIKSLSPDIWWEAHLRAERIPAGTVVLLWLELNTERFIKVSITRL